MTSLDFQKAYTNAVGLTEAFASFFERLTSASPNHPQHVKSLYSFKSMIYKNLSTSQSVGSQAENFETAPTMSSTSDEALHTHFTDRKSSKDLSSGPNSLTSLAEPIQQPKPKKMRMLHISSDNLLDQAYDSYIEILENKETKKPQNDDTNRSIEKLGNSGLGNTSIENEGDLASQSEFNINIKNLSTIFDFLSLLKANEHPDLNTLFLMAADYSHVRSFMGSLQSVFLTLAFVFFERLLVQDPNPDNIHPLVHEVLDIEVEKSKDGSNLEYGTFVHLLKEALETKKTDKSSLLFDSMCLSAEIYEASLTFFKEIVLQILTTCDSSRVATDLKDSSLASFAWMNEISQSDEQFFQMYAQILQVNLVSLSLSRDKVIKNSFNSNPKKRPIAPSASPKKSKSNSEVTIFHDRRRNASYIIYKNRDIRRTPNIESQLQKHQLQMAPKGVIHQGAEVSKFKVSPLKLAMNKPMKTEEPRALRTLRTCEDEPPMKLVKLMDDVQPKKRDVTPTVHRQDPYIAKVTSPTFGPVDELSYLPRDYSPLGVNGERSKKYKQLSLDFNPTFERSLTTIPQITVKLEEKPQEEVPSFPKTSNEHSYKEISSILSMQKEVDTLLKSQDRAASRTSGVSPILSLHKEVDALLKSPVLKEVDALLKSPSLPGPSGQSLHETSPILALHKQIDSLLKSSPLLPGPMGLGISGISGGSSYQKEVALLSKSAEQTEHTIHPIVHVSPILEMIKEADMLLKSPNVQLSKGNSYEPTHYTYSQKEIAPIVTKDFSPNSYYNIEKPHTTVAPISSFSDIMLGDYKKFESKTTYGIDTLLKKEDPVQKVMDDITKFAQGAYTSYLPAPKNPIKSIPNLLKERFSTCNKEVQLHETDINIMVAKYANKKSVEKPVSGRMLALKDKYNKIVQNKAIKKIYP